MFLRKIEGFGYFCISHEEIKSMIKFLASVGSCLSVSGAVGQTFTSTLGGVRDNPSSWMPDFVPTSSYTSLSVL